MGHIYIYVYIYIYIYIYIIYQCEEIGVCFEHLRYLRSSHVWNIKTNKFDFWRKEKVAGVHLPRLKDIQEAMRAQELGSFFRVCQVGFLWMFHWKKRTRHMTFKTSFCRYESNFLCIHCCFIYYSAIK